MISLVITAAGLSRRQPPNKLLLPLENKTVIERTISTFIGFEMEIRVVVGYQKDILIPAIEKYGQRIKIIDNPDFESGLATSLKAGISNPSPGLDYWAFCNGDKPFIKPETVQALLKTIESVRPKILVPTFKEQSGHPVFIKTVLTPELASLRGDTGARQIIQKHQNKVRYQPVSDEGVVMDMDRYLTNHKQ